MEMKNSSVSPSKYGEVPDGQYADDTAASAGAFGVAAGVLSDEELENRLIIQSKLLGLSEYEFMEFLSLRMTNIFFFTGCKYQFNKGHQFSDLKDYLPQDMKAYESTSVLSSFNIAIPISERNRLMQKFLTFQMPEKEKFPDLIILQKFEFLDAKSPDSSLYELVFHNAVFRFWRKR